MSLKSFFFLSLLVGMADIISCIAMLSWGASGVIVLSAVAFIVWSILMTIGLRKYGKRALWLLTTLPLLAYVPTVVYSISWSCSHGNLNACI